MDYLEKIAYLKGLAEGMGIDGNDKNGKLTLGIIDALSDMGETLRSIENATDSLEADVEDMSEQLELFSDILGGEEDDGLEAKCPSCGNLIEIDDEAIEAGLVTCPECGEQLEFDISCGEGCDCGGISHIHGGPSDKDDED